jgi:uncharacterized integral membrane protein (TIGR00697 family)
MKLKYKLYPENISPLYVAIATLFVCFLMISNVIVNRLVIIGGIVLTGDLFLFPITYIFGDILTEVYGFERSRLVIWLGFAANIIMALYFSFVIGLPYPADFTNNSAFISVLGSTPLIVFASITAYFLGEFTNSATLSVMKKVTRGKWLWTRTVGSTLVGQMVDTLTFMLIVFHQLPANILVQMIGVQYFFKVGYEILATPVTYLIVTKIKRYEKLDTFDYGIVYNPFSLKISKLSR